MDDTEIKMKQLDIKLCKNALIAEKLLKLDKQERQTILNKLLTTTSERKLSEELGIPRSTLNDWVTLRQCNNGNEIHISIDTMIKKLDGYKPKKEEYAKLEKLKEVIEKLLACDIKY